MNLSVRNYLWSFLHGVASIFDFTGALTMQRSSEILERSDADALRSDWDRIGEDFRRVMGEYDHD